MKNRFEQIIVIGYGKTAGDVLRYVGERQERFGYRTACIEYEIHGISKLQAVCRELGADYACIPDRGGVTETLMAVREPALVISAGNNYLFPEKVVEKGNLEIINFHSALLPKFPGRNAQSWAIYEGEQVTGATWHYVTAGVDAGDIIAQRETPVTADIKAYELTREIMELATESFRSFYEELLTRHIEGRPQPKEEGPRRLYYSWEIPGDGVCSTDDPPEKIYRMLRAMDYGKSGIFPPARIRLPDGTEAEVVRYRKEEATHLDKGQRMMMDEEGKKIILALESGAELVIRLKKQ